jgi:hypothetical protein
MFESYTVLLAVSDKGHCPVIQRGCQQITLHSMRYRLVVCIYRFKDRKVFLNVVQGKIRNY